MLKKKNREILILSILVLAAFLVFIVLYIKSIVPVEQKVAKAENPLENWTVDESDMNGRPIEEDKSIYGDEPDNSIHDVYISVFPTKDENGEMIDFSAFGKHSARDHTYNPTLNCNIQILDEDGQLDPLLSLEQRNATIRVRGNSSRGDLYKSYKIKMNEEAGEFNGQSILNLNKHSEDYSKITTKFCTDVLAEMDNMVSYRTNFMRVWIRDTSLPKEEQKFEYYGLYTHIEQPNKSFLEARGLSSDCEMYKARDFSFNLSENIKDVDDPEYSEEEFEEVLTIREGTSHEKLIQMINDVNDETQDFQAVFDKYFNEDNYLTWLAFSLLMGASDILNHNFILYSPVNSNTWYFISWDFDSNMQYKEETTNTVPEGLRGGQKLNQVILHQRFFKIPGNLEKLQAKMTELMSTYFTQDKVSAWTNGYIPVLEKTMWLYPDLGLLNGRVPIDELIPYINGFKGGIETNYNDFIKAFQYPSPMFVAQPTRNEDGSIHLSWDISYSYQGRTVTYKVQLANDYYMNDILYEADDIVENSIDADIDLEPGTYYLKVFAVDSDGNEQVSLEHYEFAGASFIYEHGVLEFTIE